MADFDPSETSFEVNALEGIKKLEKNLRNSGTGKDVKHLTISFASAETKKNSKRGETVAKLLSLMPNLVTLNLNFSGHLYTYGECFGDELETVLCSLKSLEHFSQKAMTATRTSFGESSLVKMVTSWPKLRTLYIAGDIPRGGGDYSQFPPATCALESVTFERLMCNYQDTALIMAGSADSLREFEAWTMGSRDKNIDVLLRPILPAIESIKIGGYDFPSNDFILNELSKAPKIKSMIFKSENASNPMEALLRALAEALGREGSFPCLRKIGYPGQSGTYKTGRGSSARVHKYENPGEQELKHATQHRGICATRESDDLKYEVEGVQRRKGFAASKGRRWAPY